MQNLVFRHPELLPIADIDDAFGPLVPLCRELRTSAGMIDAVYIDRQGRLTIVECKLWRNPEARRQVVAQILDYVAALSRWSYADLQRQVSAATGKQANVPFDAVKAIAGDVQEAQFIDSASRALRDGRILALVVGDGIREEVQRLSETINKGASKAFSLALIEMALYELRPTSALLVQPRVLAKTELLTRQVFVMSDEASPGLRLVDDLEMDERPEEPANKKQHLKDWWAPVLAMKFDDPEQPEPYWVGSNNVVLDTPFPGILIKAAALVGKTHMEVFLTGDPRIKTKRRWFRGFGQSSNTAIIEDFIRREQRALLAELPPGTEIDAGAHWPIRTIETEIADDEERKIWIKSTLNSYVNALRPRLRRWHEETDR